MRHIILCFILFCCFVIPLFSESPALLLVADFEYSGISEQEMELMVDLYSYTIFETGRYLVMNRYERNKLLKGFGYKQNLLKKKEAYLEAGELLQARFIVTGVIKKQDTGVSLELALWDISANAPVRTVSNDYENMSMLIDASRRITEELTNSPISGNMTTAQATGLSASLYLKPIQERLLIVLPEGILSKEIAEARLLTGAAASQLLDSERMTVTFSSYTYDISDPDYPVLIDLCDKRNCHTLGIIQKINGRLTLVFHDPEKNKIPSDMVKFQIPIDIARSRNLEADRIAKTIERSLPRLSTQMIVHELQNEILIKEKLDMLLFNERFLSQQLFVNLHQTIIKPAIAGKYHPMLNLVGLEADAIWYYSPFFGIGGGGAFSLSYPATIDNKLAAHPLVQQYELRFIPFSFRTGGNIGLLLNIITSITLQNAYQIIYDEPSDKYNFIDETWLISFKAGLALGLMIHLDDTVTIFVDLVRMSAIFPLNIGPISWDGANISGGVGGVGIILRF